MIRVTRSISLSEDEVEERFIHASGPGGQNVNKVATAVQLRFNAVASPNLPNHVCERLKRLAGRRMARDGTIVITASRFRSQERNRRDALERLLSLIEEAAAVPRKRRPTKPGKAAERRRIESKKRRSAVKKDRARPVPD